MILLYNKYCSVTQNISLKTKTTIPAGVNKIVLNIIPLKRKTNTMPQFTTFTLS